MHVTLLNTVYDMSSAMNFRFTFREINSEEDNSHFITKSSYLSTMNELSYCVTCHRAHCVIVLLFRVILLPLFNYSFLSLSLLFGHYSGQFPVAYRIATYLASLYCTSHVVFHVHQFIQGIPRGICKSNKIFFVIFDMSSVTLLKTRVITLRKQ